jgi:hypothetical protein
MTHGPAITKSGWPAPSLSLPIGTTWPIVRSPLEIGNWKIETGNSKMETGKWNWRNVGSVFETGKWKLASTVLVSSF